MYKGEKIKTDVPGFNRIFSNRNGSYGNRVWDKPNKLFDPKSLIIKKQEKK